MPGKLTGKGGSITFALITADVHTWSVDWKSEVHDVTDYADAASSERKKIVGLKDWTATVEAWYSGTNTASPDDEGQLTLDLDGTLDFSGNAILASMSVNAPKDAPITFTYNFEGNGTLLFG